MIPGSRPVTAAVAAALQPLLQPLSSGRAVTVVAIDGLHLAVTAAAENPPVQPPLPLQCWLSRCSCFRYRCRGVTNCSSRPRYCMEDVAAAAAVAAAAVVAEGPVQLSIPLRDSC